MSKDNDKVFHECGPGWQALIDPIVSRANEIGATITQIKEKYGRLRIYFYPGHADCDELYDMIDKAELESGTVCEICGKAGHLMTNSRGSWLKTLCKEHSIELGFTRKEQI